MAASANKLEIFKITNGYWYWGRPSIEELRADLREIRRSVNPDWDLAAPGLREAWERGERDKFFPYGTSSAMSWISRVGTPRRSAACDTARAPASSAGRHPRRGPARNSHAGRRW